MEFTSKLLGSLKGVSDNLLTGDPRADLMFFGVIALIVFVLVLTFLFVRRSGRSPQHHEAPGGFDRFTNIAGRIERYEMNMNAMRTEVMRNIEFLKGQVASLEADVAVLRGDAAPQREAETAELQLEVRSSSAESDEDFSQPLTSGEFSAPADFDVSPGRPSVHEAHGDTLDRTQVSSADTSKTVELAPDPLKARLQKSRLGLFEKVKGLFVSKPSMSEEMLEELEALLMAADLGVGLVSDLVAEVRAEVKRGEAVSQEMLLALLKRKVLTRLELGAPLDPAIHPTKQKDGPFVIMVVGVNGAGKTTTTAKLAKKFHAEGKEILLVAADTFRAAAVQQLVEWGNSIGVPVVRGDEKSKPATVVYDAMERAISEKTDVVIIDTAGRLHTKANLMQELEGIRNTIAKHQASAPHEVLLVLDGTTGQNALSQAKEFNEAVQLTGLVVTKLDGTPKGGIVVAVKDTTAVPIRYIGVGEAAPDLRVFEPRAFVEALFDTSENPDVQSAHGEARRRRRDTVHSIPREA